MARSVLIGIILLGIATAASAMASRAGIGKMREYRSWEVLVLPAGDDVEFAVFYRDARAGHDYDVGDASRRVRSVEAMEARLAELPRTDWISIRYHEERLPDAAAAVLRDRLKATCRSHRRRCVFAL